MPDFVLNRDYALRSLSGHMINFKKGAPTYVPPHVAKEAIAIGAEQVDGEKVDPLADGDAPEKIVPTGVEREELIFAAFEDMEARNVRGEFTGQGLPHTDALEKILGFTVDSKERNKLWQAYREKKAAE